MNLNELALSIRFDNASKGFDPLEGGVGRYLLLAVSEICEAQEELRDGRGINEIHYSVHVDPTNNGLSKPEGFPVEIADAVIRILDIGAKLNIDFSIETTTLDYTADGFTIDDWLLGICQCLALANTYDINDEGFHIHLRQALGSLFMLCDKYKIHVMTVVDEKLKYNRSRPPKHGRQF